MSVEIEPLPSGRPYGPIGLVLSSLGILLCTAFFCLLVAAVLFGVASAILGWKVALQRFFDVDLSGGLDKTFAERLNIIVGLVVYAMTALSVLLFARFRGRAHWRDLVAWHPWHPFRKTRLFWITLVATLVYSLGANALIEKIYPASKDWVTAPTGLGWALAFLMLASVAAPITEELIFRGWLYTSLRRTAGIWFALILSSVLFALAHWEKTHLYALAVFPVGLALCYVRQKTESIFASMTFHALFNGVATALLVFAK